MSLLIQYKNGLTDTVSSSDYTEYNYDGKVFTIFNNGKMIAMINIDSISGIYLKEEKEVNKLDKTSPITMVG